MAILDSAIKIKNDVVEYISVMKIYKEQNKFWRSSIRCNK